MSKQGEKQRQNTHEDSGVNVTVGGNVSGSMNVAGGDIYAETHIGQHDDTTDLLQRFDEIIQRLDTLPKQVKSVKPEDIVDAKAEVEELKREALKGEQADEGFLARRFRNIARMGPDILDVVTATLQSPAKGVARVVQMIAAKAREEAGLEPVD